MSSAKLFCNKNVKVVKGLCADPRLHNENNLTAIGHRTFVATNFWCSASQVLSQALASNPNEDAVRQR